MYLNQLPSVILNYIEASNTPDPASFVDCFAKDAIVLDEGKKYYGKQEIKDWSDQYHFGANVTLEPREMNQVNGEIIVTFKLDGTYDKTDLPNPLLLKYHFIIEEDRIKKLSIC
ncbi:nuclear transport factor 2 family protein [Paenibacillus sp. sgz500958]|uniref:nuclear transport factor 2 family protein n=1 Tax=Paenibacillus sp. sgz500958 TaxID=3242475 RepID=UPI0036D254DC